MANKVNYMVSLQLIDDNKNITTMRHGIYKCGSLDQALGEAVIEFKTPNFKLGCFKASEVGEEIT